MLGSDAHSAEYDLEAVMGRLMENGILGVTDEVFREGHQQLLKVILTCTLDLYVITYHYAQGCGCRKEGCLSSKGQKVVDGS